MREIIKSITHKQIILSLYVFFFGSFVLTFTTPPNIACISFMLSVLILSGVYSLRTQSKENSLINNHTTFMIRTFWRANLYLAYSTFLGVIYMLIFTNYGALRPCLTYATFHLDSILMNWGGREYMALLKLCGDSLFMANKIHLVIAMFLVIFPVLIYLLNRFILGWSNAVKGKNVISEKL